MRRPTSPPHHPLYNQGTSGAAAWTPLARSYPIRPVLLACVLVAVFLAAIYLWVVFVSKRRDGVRFAPLPPLISTVRHNPSAAAPRPFPNGRTLHANGGGERAHPFPHPLTEAFAPRERFAPSGSSAATPPAPVPRFHPTPARTASRREPVAPPVESETVRFARPGEQALQLLPAHLEVQEGDGRGEIIRLLCAFGEVPEITLGRGDGEAHRHVKLHSPTVSRMHARLMMRDGHWRILNLSLTNPLLVNGERVPDVGEGRVLLDGDRIDIGALALRFHER
jgi:hypothetical protein